MLDWLKIIDDILRKWPHTGDATALSHEAFQAVRREHVSTVQHMSTVLHFLRVEHRRLRACVVLCCVVLLCFVMSCVLSCLALWCCIVLWCIALCCLVLSCLVVCCLVLCCLFFSCVVVSRSGKWRILDINDVHLRLTLSSSQGWCKVTLLAVASSKNAHI
jgi:hypothetical protein